MASVTTIDRSTGTVSGFTSFDFGFLGARFFGADFASESTCLPVSRATVRGPGLASVGDNENTSADAAPTFHDARSESLICIEKVAGAPTFVLSSPAIRLFQPTVTAL